ncbi:uncharacterized protein THITE_2130035 [Thermothielavioides terrestris NRRL 8126]|uniref:F-box domain-containing protein n=1 Tax=Thermothielavioides terrestris (strain ATCC 38088 / NRRL 8126) TaxID=578455 RepID=G2R8R8_THETT|nr:uncharacterized protein THITE_2130035 [Thermothielavioides terrestris NRRL 8126]AEO68284.1 hypothetical protein THITE_2130035 [Thermothielavioides terrestris NRRL 8126]
MEDVWGRGVKRHAEDSDNGASGPKRRAGAQPSKEISGNTVPLPAPMRLPNETLLHIAGYLEEPDLWALSLVNRRFAVVATGLLRKQLYNDRRRCMEVLLWAVEVGNNKLLRELLERGVNPNFYFRSAILRSRLLDVIAAQGRRGTPNPHKDRALAAELYREHYCRDLRERKHVLWLRCAAARETPMEQDLDWNLLHAHIVERPHLPKDFGVVGFSGLSNIRMYWAWTPLHVAVQRGDNDAVRLLLHHGSDINAQCWGLCDCAALSLDSVDTTADSVVPHRFRSTWTPLHVAICSGHEETAKLLLDHGAWKLTGGLVHQVPTVHRKVRLNMTALHTAISVGNAQMCKMLLRELPLEAWYDRRVRGYQCPLLVAAAEGHIQTVGKVLLESGARLVSDAYPLEEQEGVVIRDPLSFLCLQYRYDDARWLIEFYQASNCYPVGDPAHHFTRSLAVLCGLHPRKVYHKLSLRERQDHLYRLNLSDLSWPAQKPGTPEEIEASKPERVLLAQTLLSLGADPDHQEDERRSWMQLWTLSGTQDWGCVDIGRSPLQIAASYGFAEMVKLLISHGAKFDMPPNWRRVPSELPLMLAAKQALTTTGNLETVRALLDAGASLENPGDESILIYLYKLRPRPNILTSSDHDWPSWRKWLSIVELFLQHGAAHHASPDKWKKVLLQACEPGNLPYCEMLEKARPLSDFDSETLSAMLGLIVRRCWLFPPPGLTHQGPPGFTQDTEMVGWVLRHCVDGEGRMIIPRQVVSDLQQEAYSRHMHRIVERLREFLARGETTEPETPSSSRPSMENS